MVSVELAKRAELKKVMKRVMPFVAFVKEKVAEAGMAALDTSLPWDERTVLESNKDYIGQSCRKSSVTFLSLGASAIVPGNMFRNVNVFRLKFFRQCIGSRSRSKSALCGILWYLHCILIEKIQIFATEISMFGHQKAGS